MLPIAALLAWGAACWAQGAARRAAPELQPHAHRTALPYRVIGGRHRVGATHLWTTLLARYARAQADGTDVVHTVQGMHALGHHHSDIVQLAVAMLHTLPNDTRTHELTLLVDGARRYPDQAWFALTLAVGMSRGELPAAPDQAGNWMQRASQLDPRLEAAAVRLRP